MYNHQTKHEHCIFCEFVSGTESEYKKFSDIVFEDEKTLVFISPKWWPNNPEHAIVIPKKYYENIYDIPDELLSHLHIITKQLTIAFKETYHCDGISIRQHNEPAGDQSVFHYHINVFPRYKNDNLYKNHDNDKFVNQEERKPFAEKLRKYFLAKKSGIIYS